MLSFIKKILIPNIFICVLLTFSTAHISQAGDSFQKSFITIDSQSGSHRFRVEIADTDALRAQGLQRRKSLPVGTGMLFNFKTTAPVTMWMKNTTISLDMIFLSARGVIVNIAEHTRPLSLAYIHSSGPVKSVLEIQAGTTKTLKIKVGDRIHHSIFEGTN